MQLKADKFPEECRFNQTGRVYCLCVKSMLVDNSNRYYLVCTAGYWLNFSFNSISLILNICTAPERNIFFSTFNCQQQNWNHK